MMFLTSASVILKITEIETRRKFMSRTADSVLMTSIWTSAKNTFSVELVRLPSFPRIYYSFPWCCISGIVIVKSPAHHLLKYLVNMDLTCSAPCSCPRPQARSLRALWPERHRKVCCKNEARWVEGGQVAEDVQESYQGSWCQWRF